MKIWLNDLINKNKNKEKMEYTLKLTEDEVKVLDNIISTSASNYPFGVVTGLVKKVFTQISEQNQKTNPQPEEIKVEAE